MVGSDKMRVDRDFKRSIDRIRLERIKNGKDKRERTSARITKAFTRASDFTKIEKEIINATFKDE